jgi:tetratricopeptide (TPR) repeat protein
MALQRCDTLLWAPLATVVPRNKGYATRTRAYSRVNLIQDFGALALEMPYDAFAYVWTAYVGTAKLYVGRYDEAVTWLRRSIEMNRNYSIGHFLLAAALGQYGMLDEARAIAAAGLAFDPTFTLRRFRRNAISDNPVYLAGRERAIEGMRKAGVPEG